MIDHVEPAGTVSFSLTETYPIGMHSAVYRATYIDGRGVAQDAVVKFSLVDHDDRHSVHEEISALRRLSEFRSVVRLIGTTRPSSASSRRFRRRQQFVPDAAVVEPGESEPPESGPGELETETWRWRRTQGDYEVELPGLVLERLQEPLSVHVHSAVFWSAGFESVGAQLRCISAQILESVMDVLRRSAIYSADFSASNILVTPEIWRDERRAGSACVKVKLIDFASVAHADTHDEKISGLAVTCKKLDEHENAVQTTLRDALADEQLDEPYRTIHAWTRETFDSETRGFAVGPDALAEQELREFVREFPPHSIEHARRVCSTRVSTRPDSWCATLLRALLGALQPGIIT